MKKSYETWENCESSSFGIPSKYEEEYFKTTIKSLSLPRNAKVL